MLLSQLNFETASRIGNLEVVLSVKGPKYGVGCDARWKMPVLSKSTQTTEFQCQIDMIKPKIVGCQTPVKMPYLSYLAISSENDSLATLRCTVGACYLASPLANYSSSCDFRVPAILSVTIFLVVDNKAKVIGLFR